MKYRQKRGPRIQITLSEETARVLREMREVTGRPVASMISDLCDEAVPVLAQQVRLLQAVREKPEEARAMVQRWALESTHAIAQASLDLDAGEDRRTVRGRRGRAHSAKPG